MRPSALAHRKRHQFRGWRPLLDEDGAAIKYHKAVDEQIDNAQNSTLKDLGNYLVKAALTCKKIDNLPDNSRRPEEPRELKRLISERYQCRDRAYIELNLVVEFIENRDKN